jgi:hypothetical protein
MRAKSTSAATFLANAPPKSPSGSTAREWILLDLDQTSSA